MYLSLKALTKISDGMESKPILKGTRLQSISCRFVENYFAVQSICDRVLNFDMQPHYQKQTLGSDVMDYNSVHLRVPIVSVPLVRYLNLDAL